MEISLTKKRYGITEGRTEPRTDVNQYTPPPLFQSGGIITSSCMIVTSMFHVLILMLSPIALRKAKIVYNFGLSECNRV